jgi:hypothetical protein
MRHKKQPNASVNRAVVREARAGIVFACDHIEAELSAAISHIGHTVNAYTEVFHHSSADRAITDILADLRHYCDRNGLVFDTLNAAAEQQYLVDKADLA